MSCALWHLHESIERNDPNQLFLLSDQTEIRSVAQRLNIIVRSCKELDATIASKINKVGLDTFGDLEREFGVQEKIAVSPTHDAGEVKGEDHVPDIANTDLKDEDVMNNSVSSEGTAKTEGNSIMHEQAVEKQSFERREEKSSVNGDRYEDMVKEHDPIADTTARSGVENILKKPAESVGSVKGLVDTIIQQDSQQHLRGSITGLKVDSVNSQRKLANQPASGHSAMQSPSGTPQPEPQSVEPVQCLQEVQTINDTSPSELMTTPSTSTMEAAQEQEDSDEEVVVFIPQPKRLSAQHKPAHQSSRPSTPKEQSQQKSGWQSPQKSLGRPQSKGKAARHSPNPSVVGQAHPQPINSPTVIDPDAFGRDFRVNINPSPRHPHNSNGHSNHRSRGNVQNTQVGQMPRNSPRRLSRTSPPRNALKENLQRLTPVPGPTPKDAPNHRRQASRASPRRGPTPNAEEVTSRDVESRATAAAVLSESQFPESPMLEPTELESQIATALPDWSSSGSTDFVPRSANTEFKPNSPQPKIYESNVIVHRPSRPAREFKPRAPKPKIFEAAEFVPRDFVPKTTSGWTGVQHKQYSPEPESIEPRPSINDVDYVLKSGSTRASARGRGRLWTPS